MPKLRTPSGVVGERSINRRRLFVRIAGGHRNEDAGMSTR